MDAARTGQTDVKSQLTIPLAVFAAAAALYLAFPTKDFYWDGVGFALTIEHPGWFGMIEANHPVYIGFGWLLHSVAGKIVAGGGALSLLQAANSVLAAGAVLIVYETATRLFADRVEALLLAATFAFSATWWKFATDADAYIPAVLLLLVAARLLLPGQRARPITVAVVHAGAMLFHELAALFLAAGAVGIYVQSREKRQDAMRNTLTYLAAAIVLTSAAYYACFRLATGYAAVSEFFRWITYHTPDSSFSFAAVRNAWLSSRGTMRLFVGGRAGLVRHSLAALGVVLPVLAAGAFFVWTTTGKHDRLPISWSAKAFLWSWIAPYALFLFFWMPQNTFYRLFYLPPLAILAGGAIEKLGGRRAMFAAAGLLGAWNFLFYIYPHSMAEANPVLRAALAVRPVWKPGTWVYVGSFNADNWTVFCFNPQVTFKGIGRMSAAEIGDEVKNFEKAGHEAWIDRSGLDLLQAGGGEKEWLTSHTRPQFKLEFSDSKHKIAFARLFP
jgi:hypothetical protein